jgi:hypothetical protein
LEFSLLLLNLRAWVRSSEKMLWIQIRSFPRLLQMVSPAQKHKEDALENVKRGIASCWHSQQNRQQNKYFSAGKMQKCSSPMVSKPM